MATTKIIKVSDFTTIPGPRRRASGDNSAEEFFEDYILPVLNENNETNIIIDFSGTWGYSFSFISQLGIFIFNKLGKDTFSRVRGIADDNPEVVERFVKLLQEYANERK